MCQELYTAHDPRYNSRSLQASDCTDSRNSSSPHSTILHVTIHTHYPYSRRVRSGSVPEGLKQRHERDSKTGLPSYSRAAPIAHPVPTSGTDGHSSYADHRVCYQDHRQVRAALCCAVLHCYVLKCATLYCTILQSNVLH
jgi:hypothetical protein